MTWSESWMIKPTAQSHSILFSTGHCKCHQMKVSRILTWVLFCLALNDYSKWKVKDIWLLAEARTWKGLCLLCPLWYWETYTISMTASGDSTRVEMNNKDVILHYLNLQEVSHVRVCVVFKYGVGESNMFQEMTYTLHFSCFIDDFPFTSAIYLSNTATVIF